MSSLVNLQFMFYNDFRWLLVLYTLISSVLFGLYLRANEYDKWWVGCIPLIGRFCKWKCGGVFILLPLLNALLQLRDTIGGADGIIMFVDLLVFMLEDFWFAHNYVPCNPALYGFVPGAKLVYMIKEILNNGSRVQSRN